MGLPNQLPINFPYHCQMQEHSSSCSNQNLELSSPLLCLSHPIFDLSANLPSVPLNHVQIPIWSSLCVCESLSHGQLFATQWTAAHQVSLSMRFSRQRYWSGFPFPSPGDLPNPGIEPGSPALQADSLPTELQGKPHCKLVLGNFLIITRVQASGPAAAAAAAAKSLQSCPTLCDPINSSPPGSTVPGILQATILEWVAISFSNA